MEYNITFQEEPFGKLNEEEILYADPSYYYTFDVWGLIEEVFEICVLALSVLGALLMIYVILKFSYLKTRTNMYLIHYSIANILFDLVTPTYELILKLGMEHIVNADVFCAVYRIDGTSVSLCLTFGTCLGIDYFIDTYLKKWLDLYEKIQKYIISAIYLAYLIEYIIVIVPCFGAERIFTNEIGVIIYCILLVLVIGINIFKCVKKPEDNSEIEYACKICNYIVFTWTPLLGLYFFIVYLVPDQSILTIYIMLFEFVVKLVVYIPPFIIALWLPKLDRNFQKAYNVVFRRALRKYNREDLDGDEDVEGTADSTPILI